VSVFFTVVHDLHQSGSKVFSLITLRLTSQPEVLLKAGTTSNHRSGFDENTRRPAQLVSLCARSILTAVVCTHARERERGVWRLTPRRAVFGLQWYISCVLCGGC